MFEIRIYEKKNKKLGRFITSIKYVTEQQAIKAYELLKKQSSEGYKTFPVDSEVLAYRKQQAKDLVYPDKLRTWKCDYDPNGKTCHKPYLDERYKWSYEEADHPKKGTVIKRAVPEFNSIKYPSTIITYPKKV